MPDRCADIRKSFQAALDGDLPPTNRKEFDRHLAACPGCRRAYGAATRTLAVFQAVPAAEPPRAFVRNVMLRLETAKARAARRRQAGIWFMTATAAASAAGLVAAWSRFVAPAAGGVAAAAVARGAEALAGGATLARAVAKPLGVFTSIASALGEAAWSVVGRGLSEFALLYVAGFAAFVILNLVWWARRPVIQPQALIP